MSVYLGSFFTSINGVGYIQDSVGNLYSLGKTFFQDGASPITVTGKTPLIDNNNIKRKFWNEVSLVGDSIITTCNISYSDDDYQTFSNPISVDMSSGKPSVYSQGQSRRRAYQWSHTDNTPLRIQAIEAIIVEGS